MRGHLQVPDDVRGQQDDGAVGHDVEGADAIPEGRLGSGSELTVEQTFVVDPRT